MPAMPNILHQKCCFLVVYVLSAFKPMANNQSKINENISIQDFHSHEMICAQFKA